MEQIEIERDDTCGPQAACVWFSDIQCPIRKKIRTSGSISRIVKPNSEMGAMMSDAINAMSSKIPIDIQILPQYCNICHLRKKKLSEVI